MSVPPTAHISPRFSNKQRQEYTHPDPTPRYKRQQDINVRRKNSHTILAYVDQYTRYFASLRCCIQSDHLHQYGLIVDLKRGCISDPCTAQAHTPTFQSYRSLLSAKVTNLPKFLRTFLNCWVIRPRINQTCRHALYSDHGTTVRTASPSAMPRTTQYSQTRIPADGWAWPISNNFRSLPNILSTWLLSDAIEQTSPPQSIYVVHSSTSG